LDAATNESEAKATQLSRGDMRAMQLSSRDRLVYRGALDAVKAFEASAGRSGTE
jgi:hypothetical protein